MPSALLATSFKTADKLLRYWKQREKKTKLREREKEVVGFKITQERDYT